MKWIDPKIIPPLSGRKYLVLYKDEGDLSVALAKAVEDFDWDEEHKKRIPTGDMYFKSLHDPHGIRGVKINADSREEGWIKSVTFSAKFIAYAEVTELPLPSFYKKKCNCE